MKLHLPTGAAIALSLAAGVLTVVNTTVLQFISPWNTYTTVALVFVAALGIGPLTGPAFRAALHLSQNVATAIGAVLAVAATAVTTLNVSTAAQAVLLGVLTVAAGLGFAPAITTVPAVPGPVKAVTKP